MLWKTYLLYALSPSSPPTTTIAGGQHLIAPSSPSRPNPTFRTVAAQYRRRLLHRERLWQLVNDFGLVPTIVNTVRFNKLMAAVGSERISYRQFLQALVDLADAGFPQLGERPNRLVRVCVSVPVRESARVCVRVRECGCA